jgi:hypothetical protein
VSAATGSTAPMSTRSSWCSDAPAIVHTIIATLKRPMSPSRSRRNPPNPTRRPGMRRCTHHHVTAHAPSVAANDAPTIVTTP